MSVASYFKLGATLVLLALVALGARSLYQKGRDAGAAAVRAEWNKANAKADKETAELRAEGYKLAANLAVQLRDIETRSARTGRQLRDALKAPVTCGTSGTLADVVVPAAAVDSMFVRNGGAADPPGPGASGASATVR